MASDLPIAVLAGGAVLHVHRLDDGIAAEFPLDLQQCSLHVMLTPHITVRNADMAIVPLSLIHI